MTRVELPAAVKDEVTLPVVLLCAKCMWPYDIASGAGFAKVAERLISIGVLYGNLKAEDVLPNRATIARKLAEMASQIRSSLVPVMVKAINESHSSITTDRWTDDFRKSLARRLLCTILTASDHYTHTSCLVTTFLTSRKLARTPGRSCNVILQNSALTLTLWWKQLLWPARPQILFLFCSLITGSTLVHISWTQFFRTPSPKSS